MRSEASRASSAIWRRAAADDPRVPSNPSTSSAIGHRGKGQLPPGLLCEGYGCASHGSNPRTIGDGSVGIARELLQSCEQFNCDTSQHGLDSQAIS